MPTLEDLILAAAEEKVEAERVSRAQNEETRRLTQQNRADKAYSAYWARRAVAGVDDASTANVYYSLRRNETLAKKLTATTDEWDYSLQPSSPKKSLLPAVSLSLLLTGAVLLKKFTASEELWAPRSTYLDSRMIRQTFSYSDLKSSLRRLSSSDDSSLPRVTRAMLDSLTCTQPQSSVRTRTPSLSRDRDSKVNVLVFWRPSDASSTRVLDILKQLSRDDVSLVPVIVPKYPSDAEYFDEALDSLFVDQGKSCFRKLGCNVVPTVVVLSPNTAADGSAAVLFALEGERALTEVVVSAIAAVRGDSSSRLEATPALTTTPKSTATATALKSPTRIAVHPLSGVIYLSDTANNRVLEISKDGVVKRIFGSKSGGSGPAAAGAAYSEVVFNHPMGLAVDAAADVLYVADFGNNAVRRVDLKTGSAVCVAVADADRDSNSVAYDFPELSEIESELSKKLTDLGSMAVR
jgi:hypothetical protein